MKKAKEVNINELATKKELASGLENLAGMMSRSFDKLNETIVDFRSDMQSEFKSVKSEIKDVQGRVSNIEVALRQDQTRIAILERKQGVI